MRTEPNQQLDELASRVIGAAIEVHRELGGRSSALRPMSFRNSNPESQRDSGSKPRVARYELPWENAPQTDNPNGVAARRNKRDTTPLGLKTYTYSTQGSSCLATLGWRTQSRWDCRNVSRCTIFKDGVQSVVYGSQSNTIKSSAWPNDKKLGVWWPYASTVLAVAILAVVCLF